MPATPQNRRPAKRVTQGQTGRWKLYSLLFVSLLIIVTGFFFAGRQHFSSWDYSMKNSRLRKQVDELETEKRRLQIAREVAMSPNEIKRVAKKFGINEPELAVAPNTNAVKPAAAKDRAVPTLATSGKAIDSRTDGYSVVTASLKMPVARFGKPEREIRKEQAE